MVGLYGEVDSYMISKGMNSHKRVAGTGVARYLFSQVGGHWEQSGGSDSLVASYHKSFVFN